MNRDKFDRLLGVKTFEDAEIFKGELLRRLKEQEIKKCGRGIFCPCVEEHKICIFWVYQLLNAVCTQFMALGLPISILDDLEENDRRYFPPMGLKRAPNINLLLRYSSFIDSKLMSTNIFLAVLESGNVDFLREMFVLGLVKIKNIRISKSVSQEIEELLREYGASFVIDEKKVFDFDREISKAEKYFPGCVKNTLEENKDMERRMALLKYVPRHPFFSISMFTCAILFADWRMLRIIFQVRISNLFFDMLRITYNSQLKSLS